MGVIFNAVGAVVCSLTIAFIAGWKLSFIVLLFTPLMVFAGILQGRRMSNTKKPNEKKTGNLSWDEQGGTVEMNFFLIDCKYLFEYLSMQRRQLIVFEQSLVFIKKNILFLFMKIVLTKILSKIFIIIKRRILFGFL
jgi:hypothetical protein